MKPAKLLLFSVAILFSGLHLTAQPHTLLQDFSGYQDDNYLVLRWTFRSGSLCEGTRIERSTGGLIYTEIGRIPGFCGNPDSPITYTFVDSLPGINTVNYYRLELGNYGYTADIPVEFIKTSANGFVVLTAGNGQTEILFNNTSGRTGTAVMYSYNGKRIFESGINGKRLILPSGKFSPGVYLLILAFSDNTSVSGNFIIY
ncbi:MAG: hypothetical protein V1775_02435 [Bacteroidota bacterium]